MSERDPWERKLLDRLTPEFLETLVLAVRVCGWDVDMNETVSLARYCYRLAGQEPPPDLGDSLPDEPA